MALIHQLSSNATFFDVGANIGYFTLLVASLGRRVVAVEPTQYHRALMQVGPTDHEHKLLNLMELGSC
jgi:FkbM family methyltransferase